MTKLRLIILGSNSALPIPGRYPSAQLLRFCDQHILIDCGEGTQLRMSELKVKRSKIDNIFISHLHGDHVFGLPGLLNSFSLNNRQAKLIITGPVGIQSFINSFISASSSYLSYELEIREITAQSKTLIDQIGNIGVYAFPLRHRLPTNGYLFVEREPKRNLIKEKLEELNLTIDQIRELKSGNNIVTDAGIEIAVDEVTHPPQAPLSYAYCSDTIYTETIVPWLSGVVLLYHESTYLEEHANLALDRMHSTAKEAALIAQKAQVQQLLLGHFSSRYADLEAFVIEAQEVFNHCMLAQTGTVIDLN